MSDSECAATDTDLYHSSKPRSGPGSGFKTRIQANEAHSKCVCEYSQETDRLTDVNGGPVSASQHGVAFPGSGGIPTAAIIAPMTPRSQNFNRGGWGTQKKGLKEILKDARKLTLCVDGWSKKGLTASFLGVSACFYHPPGGRVYHALLSLHRLDHPHTGECIARCIDETMVAWDIVGDKVLLVVTDNGLNIVKAVRLLSERPRQEIEPSAHSTRLPPGDGLDDVSWEEEEPESESDEENGDISESGDFGK
ncbi:hypothetical protein D9C73_023399 [Collichthys lucidus]|uniref:Uncharacterized protein n=1 Tax=Collichthys lucidus TaxID=240159 RepID=A0A4U5VK29_COLLU|nr:hypothetical protein D9C73_023399 [Collichthys lucidus]